MTTSADRPSEADIARITSGTHHNPHAVLGAHPHDGTSTAVRAYRPGAEAIAVLTDERRVALTHLADGFFTGLVDSPLGDYQLEVRYHDHTVVLDDPYRWLPTLGEFDLHLISQGRHERLWEVLGAHLRSYDTPSGVVEGVSFAVWAPTAQGVRVCGEFDDWSGQAYPMRSLGTAGVWELFLPGIGAHTPYTFRILAADGTWHQKADPLAFRAQTPPGTASVVFDSSYTWNDSAWLSARTASPPHRTPISIYEVHLGSWHQGLDYRTAATALADYATRMGFTHVELLPLAEHPYGGSWGYQVTSYYAPASRYGSPDDLCHLIDTLHTRGIGVIIDWVPAHFPRDSWALARFDGTAQYEHPDPRRGEHPDWGTYIVDFGRPEVRNFFVANALFWFTEFHIDGLRVDAVASMLYLDYSRPEGAWLPNEHGGRENLDAVCFLQELNATVYRHHPDVMMIAEDSTSWPGVTHPTHHGGLGFGFKWNLGWTNDTLRYVSRDPVHRSYHHHEMTFAQLYAWHENFVLPLSHDEVVHGKGSLWSRMPGDDWNKAAGLRALLAYVWAHPGKKLLFMGGEFGQRDEWSHTQSLDWHLLDDPLHAGIATLVRDLNTHYRKTPALWAADHTPDGFSWIDANDSASNVFSFLRIDPADPHRRVLACVANFAGIAHHDYHIGLPAPGRWREVLNTDAEDYGGSGVGNLGTVTATAQPWHGRPASATIQLPPCGAIWLEPAEHTLRPA